MDSHPEIKVNDSYVAQLVRKLVDTGSVLFELTFLNIFARKSLLVLMIDDFRIKILKKITIIVENFHSLVFKNKLYKTSYIVYKTTERTQFC